MLIEDEMRFPPATLDEGSFLNFVKDNSHIGYGRMMQLISEYWRVEDPIGALTVGPTCGACEPFEPDRI